MRRLGLVAALAFALAAIAQGTPARADPFDSYQEGSLLECVVNSGSDQAALHRCVGSAANPCSARDGGATSSYVLCWSHEADSWRALMHGAIGDLNQRNPARDPQRLAATSAAWEAWAEAECDYWAWEEGGGSGEQVDRVQCLARVTAERAIALMVAAGAP